MEEAEVNNLEGTKEKAVAIEEADAVEEAKEDELAVDARGGQQNVGGIYC